MNAERLIKHFDRIAEAPGAVPRLRRFVLDLAVRGRLLTRHPHDESVDALLERVRQEAHSQREAGGLRRPRMLAEIDSEETPFAIPTHWRWVRLADIAPYIQRGKSPTYASSDGSPVVSQRCVRWEGLDLAPAKAISKQSLARYEPIRFLRSGDLLWNSTGTGTIGRVAKVGDVPPSLVCDSHVTVVRCAIVDPDFVRCWLRSDHVYGQIEQRASGATNQVELTSAMALNQLVPLPPLAEQRRIVTKVDDLMALCDRLERAGQEQERRRQSATAATLRSSRQPASRSAIGEKFLKNFGSLWLRSEHITELRLATLDLAAMGKLGLGASVDQSARSLLHDIAEERTDLIARKIIRREKPPAPVRDDDVPYDLPPTWCWSRLGDVVLFTQYGTSQKAREGADGVGVLAMGNIQNGTVSLEARKSIPRTSAELPDLLLEKFDLLYNRTNSAELVGKTGIYLGESGARTFASYLIRLRPSLRSTNPRFLNAVMNAPVFRETQVVPLIRQQTGQANVNGSALRNMLIPLPPVEEQHLIVAMLDEIMGLCDRLEAQLALCERESARFLEAVLHETLADEDATRSGPSSSTALGGVGNQESP